MSSTKEIKNQILKSLVSMLNNSNDLIVKRDVSKQIKALLTLFWVMMFCLKQYYR